MAQVVAQVVPMAQVVVPMAQVVAQVVPMKKIEKLEIKRCFPDSDLIHS